MQSRDKCFTLTNHIYYTLHTLTLLFAQIYMGTTCHPPARRQDWAQWCLNQINTEDDKKLLIPDIPTTSGLWFRVSFHKIFCWKTAIQQEVKLINRKYYNRNSVQPNFYFWQAALLVCLRRQIQLVMQNFTSHLFLLFHKNNFLDRPSAVMLHTTDFSI